MCERCVIDKAGLWHDLTIRSCAQRRTPIEMQPDELRILRRQLRALREQAAQSGRRPAELIRHHVEVFKGSVLQSMTKQTLHFMVRAIGARADRIGERDGLVPYFHRRPREERRHHDGAHAKSDDQGARLTFESKRANGIRIDVSGRPRSPAEFTCVPRAPTVTPVENTFDMRIRCCDGRQRALGWKIGQRPHGHNERRVIEKCDCHISTLGGDCLEVPGGRRDSPGSSPGKQAEKARDAQ
jgi:hypothetical protein